VRHELEEEVALFVKLDVHRSFTSCRWDRCASPTT
jgi:hypothetical protein